MGNRGNVVFSNKDWTEFSPCVYLHWNGGPESVYGFLEELNRRKIRADQCYEAARFIQIVGEFFDQKTISTTSLGVCNGPKNINELNKLQTDMGDNGIYVVSRDGEEMKVRRFMLDYSHEENLLNEMNDESVRKEKKEADGDEYRAGFRELYIAITANKKIQGD